MIKIIVPFLFIEWARLTKLRVFGPSVMIILSKMTHFLSNFVDLLRRSASRVIFSFFLCTCWWMISRSLISWSNSSSWSVGLVAFLFWLLASRRERESLLVCVEWLECSPWRCYLLRRHDEGWCFAEDCGSEYTGGGRQCWGLVLKCYELRTRKHKMLMIKALRPPKHYLP
jgi:hypothetical protein